MRSCSSGVKVLVGADGKEMEAFVFMVYAEVVEMRFRSSLSQLRVEQKVFLKRMQRR